MNLSTRHDAGFEWHRKLTRSDVFPVELVRVVSWAEPCAVISRCYPKVPEPRMGVEPTMGMAPDSIAATVWGSM